MNRYHLFEICEINPKKDIPLDNSSSVTFLPMEAVSTDGTIDTSRTILVEQVKNYSAFKDNDILFAKITPCMENGKGAIVSNLKNGYGAGSTEFIVLRPKDMVSSKWLYYFLSQKNFRMHCQQHMTGSAGQKRVPAKFLANCEIGVPTLEEQERIVARIEELFSQLDSGVETLKKTKEQLAVYRQAVLKEAFASSNAQRVRLEDLCYFITKGTTPAKTAMTSGKGEIPFIKVYNLTFDNTLDFSIDPTFVDKDTHSEFLGRSIVLPGDVLMNIVGPPMGKVSIVPELYSEWNINQAIARFRCLERLYNKYLAYFLGYSDTVEKMKSRAKATAGQFNLTLEICRDIQIPIPSVEEQKKIVFDIETKLSQQQKIADTIELALQQAEAMRQSILKKAFEGEI